MIGYNLHMFLVTYNIAGGGGHGTTPSPCALNMPVQGHN